MQLRGDPVSNEKDFHPDEPHGSSVSKMTRRVRGTSALKPG